MISKRRSISYQYPFSTKFTILGVAILFVSALIFAILLESVWPIVVALLLSFALIITLIGSELKKRKAVLTVSNRYRLSLRNRLEVSEILSSALELALVLFVISFIVYLIVERIASQPEIQLEQISQFALIGIISVILTIILTFLYTTILSKNSFVGRKLERINEWPISVVLLVTISSSLLFWIYYGGQFVDIIGHIPIPSEAWRANIAESRNYEPASWPAIGFGLLLLMSIWNAVRRGGDTIQSFSLVIIIFVVSSIILSIFGAQSIPIIAAFLLVALLAIALFFPGSDLEEILDFNNAIDFLKNFGRVFADIILLPFRILRVTLDRIGAILSNLFRHLSIINLLKWPYWFADYVICYVGAWFRYWNELIEVIGDQGLDKDKHRLQLRHDRQKKIDDAQEIWNNRIGRNS